MALIIMKIFQRMCAREASCQSVASTCLISFFTTRGRSVNLTFLDRYLEFHPEAGFIGKLSSAAILSSQQLMLDSRCKSQYKLFRGNACEAPICLKIQKYVVLL